MDDRFDALLAQQRRETGAITQVGDDEVGRRRDRRAVAVAEVVEDGNPVAGVRQLFDDHAADVAGATGDENVHRTLPEMRHLL